jgi:hypothetical protein
VLAIAVIAALGPSLPHALVAVGFVWWPWYARIVRGEVGAQAVRSHVDAARLAGVGRTRLALRNLRSGAFPAVLVTASLDVGSLVLILAGLSFIGLGSPPPTLELGAMAARGMPYLLGHPWIPRPQPLPYSCSPSPPTWPATACAISSKTTKGGTVSRRLLLLLLAVIAMVGSACTSTPPPPQGSEGGTLRLAYLADMAQADPDVFYDIEGNTVILSVYEGLVKYKPDSTEVIPSLAQSWEMSPDGLTYTFHLRTGVTFHDGTPLDAQAVKTSFQRRLDVGAAPAYMVQPIASMQTPDSSTFLVRLKHPVAPFLYYMASSWGPKIISPKALPTMPAKTTPRAGRRSTRTEPDRSS